MTITLAPMYAEDFRNLDTQNAAIKQMQINMQEAIIAGYRALGRDQQNLWRRIEDDLGLDVANVSYGARYYGSEVRLIPTPRPSFIDDEMNAVAAVVAQDEAKVVPDVTEQV